MALRPAWSGALLVLFGILMGTQILPWMRNGNNASGNGQAMNVMAKPPLTDDQLSKMVVGGINFSPSADSGSPDVQLQLSAEQPLVLSGNVQDSDMRRVLTYMVVNGERFDAGLRLDCLEALKTAARDQQVRHALIVASRKDQNPAVRMKALESLRDSALDHDANPGVRVEAVNVLVGSLHRGGTDELAPAPPTPPAVKAPPRPLRPEDDQSLERVVSVLQQLQHRDPSRYVRLRSAAALRQIGPREVQ